MRTLIRLALLLLAVCAGGRSASATTACPWVYPVIPLNFMVVETKSVTWAPDTVVTIYNSGVPADSVAYAVQTWNSTYEGYESASPKKLCHLPLFTTSGPGTGQRINMSCGPINVAGCTAPCVTRGIILSVTFPKLTSVARIMRRCCRPLNSR